MVSDDANKRSDIARLISEIRAAKVELLSAQCAADRLRLQYSVRDIAAFGERRALEGAIASAHALHRFFSEIEAEFAAATGEHPDSSSSPSPFGLRRDRSE